MDLNNIVDTIKEAANNHILIQDFIFGDDLDIKGTPDNKYNLAWLSFSDSGFSVETIGGNKYITMPFYLWILDKINDQKPDGKGYLNNNRQHIFSTCLHIGLDIFQAIQTNEREGLAEFTTIQLIEPVENKDPDYLAGMKFEFQIQLPLSMFCVIPVND